MANVPRPLPSLAALGIVQVACGESHSAALTVHGQILTWGRGKYGALGLGSYNSCSWPQLVLGLPEPAFQVCDKLIRVPTVFAVLSACSNRLHDHMHAPLHAVLCKAAIFRDLGISTCRPARLTLQRLQAPPLLCSSLVTAHDCMHREGWLDPVDLMPGLL